jgi:catalase
MGGFASYAEKIDAQKVRARSESFFDHFSQAALFYNSQSEPEKAHIIKALRFELGKVETPAIRERMVYVLSQVDKTLASRVAEGLGISVPTKIDEPLNRNVPADVNPKSYQPKRVNQEVGNSPALSMANTVKDSIKTRKIAVLAADGFDDTAVAAMKKALVNAGAQVKLIAPRLGFLKGASGEESKIDFSFLTAASVLFDAVYVPGGEPSVTALKREPDAIHFVNEAYKHCKAIAATGAGIDLLNASAIGAEKNTEAAGNGKQVAAEEGVVVSREGAAGKVATEFIKAIAQHRYWSRELNDQTPA